MGRNRQTCNKVNSRLTAIKARRRVKLAKARKRGEAMKFSVTIEATAELAE